MIRLAALSLLLTCPAAAEELLALPENAVTTLTEIEAAGRYEIPTGPWETGGMPAFEAEGAIRREVWRIGAFQGGTGVLLAVFSGQLESAGFEETFSCTARVCGGFDFRFALDIAPEPEMHVDIADYAFYAARRPTPEGPEYVALVVSEGGGNGYVQVVHVAPEPEALSEVTLSSSNPEIAAEAPATLAEALREIGRAPLPGIAFDYGATTLRDPEVPALRELAEYLVENPEVRLTLVGHTDAEGGLDGNIAVSRARAHSVLQTLVDHYGISPGRLAAEGVGYLMPLAPNTTEEGRDRNRRVEAVLVNTD